MIGASPEEAPGEVWAVGTLGEVPAQVGGRQIAGPPPDGLHVLLRRSDAERWQVMPVVDAAGAGVGYTGSPTPTGYQAVGEGGAVALLGTGTGGQSALITREPGGSFATAPVPPSIGAEPVLPEGEQLYSSTTPHAVALDEGGALDAGGHSGALIVPEATSAGARTDSAGVLHYDGSRWTREPICANYQSGQSTCATSEDIETLEVLDLAATSPENAWLLAAVGSSHPTLALFRREATGSGGFVWVRPSGWSFESALPAGASAIPLSNGAKMLTVTSGGVWVDAEVGLGGLPRGSASQLFASSSPKHSLGLWCYPSPQASALYPTAQALCGEQARSLATQLPERYSSFAWPGPGEEPGTRIITGAEHGALLVLHEAGDFHYATGVGKGVSGVFASPDDGWLAGVSTIGGNGAQVVHVTVAPESSSLQAWPVPFGRPLLAIAPEPGTTPGDPNAQALAVGEEGQIARYIPGEGWTPEFLYNAAGAVQRVRLRGVAWPEPGRAYTVGDNGAMWVWRADTGLWEPDPAEPLGLAYSLNAVAFSPSDPNIGYAVGKQGTLLSYGKTWVQEPPPAGLEHADFTSVAFAGGEALATYRLVNAAQTGETGGLIVNHGSHWEVNPTAQTTLAQLPDPSATVLSRVAGLPDGGAVAAGPGVVIERDSAGAEWRFSDQPLPEAQNVDALAAIREGSTVRALVSIDADELGNPNENAPGSANPWLKVDVPVPPAFGQPPPLLEPDPLPVSGYLLRETSSGWQDLQHQAYPNPLNSPVNFDEPAWPDAVLALDVDPNGAQGWAVGGQTGAILAQSSVKGAQSSPQTATAARLGPGPAPPQSSGTPISTPSGEATFAVGGNAQCAGPCAGFANDGLGPDVWLSAALARAAQISGLRGFLYTGAHLAPTVQGQPPLSPEAFAREMGQYAADLGAAGATQVYPEASPSDVEPGTGLATFDATILGELAGTAPPGTPTPPPSTAAYAFDSNGSGGTVRVVVLDYSAATLAPGELGWLTAQLDSSKASGIPAIVMGSADIVDPEQPNYAQDAPQVAQVLLGHGASAYMFDSPEANRSERLGSGAASIPAIGTGTLGYVLSSSRPQEFLGASGFLLLSVDAARIDPSSNRAPVSVTLIPNISQLAIDAGDGTLLRRSQVALFEGLARRPPAGFELAGGTSSSAVAAPEPYVPIPDVCEGADCGQFIAPSYTFSSSKPDIGNFVEHDPTNANPRAVLQGPGGKPIPDSQSGLFCAFNAGTTTVSIQTGGLSYSEQVTIQAGSVEQPCGTVPLINPPPAESALHTPLAPLAPNQAPGSSPTPLTVVPPPLPVSVLAAPVSPRVARAPTPRTPFFVLPPPSVPLAAALLPLSPVLARPIPPSGSAPVSVFSPAVAPEDQREEEEAIESVHNMAAYSPEEPTLPPGALVALLVLAAGAGANITLATRRSRARRRPALAGASTTRAIRSRSRRSATVRRARYGRRW
jgi:hypothetical protein